MISDVEHLFMYLLAFQTSLEILDSNPLSDKMLQIYFSLMFVKLSN